MEERVLLQTYREYVVPLYEYASRRCGADRGLAEDVTQEVWLRAVKAWERDGLPEKPLAWLKTVARNLIINYFRQNRPVSLEVLPPDWTSDLSDGSGAGPPENGLGIDGPEAAALVNWGLSRLRPAQAKLIEAYHLEGLKVAEIARDTGLSERAVEGRLRRGRQKLRKHLESVVSKNGAPR